MKERLIVQNIGPISDVDIEINKVNIYIGPQSIGKSTLAKVISFCAWLEKNILMNQGTSHIDKDFLRQNLLVYHKLTSFFNASSYIEYSSALISFSFHSLNDFKIAVVGDMKRTDMRKITYIPAERNIISIPNISTLSLENNYIRDFIFDWLLIHGKFTNEYQIELLGIGGSYSFDTNKGDIITLEDGKEIPLNQSSSGLQSVVPLLVFLAYGADWIFHNEPDLSFDNFNSLQKSILKSLSKDEELEAKVFEAAIKTPAINQALGNIYHFARHHSSEIEANEGMKEIRDLVNHIGKPHSSFFVIEEPEENLFPSTQYELVKHIFRMLDNGNDNKLVITTHSPYIMTSINNLIQCQTVLEESNTTKEELERVMNTRSFISYEDIDALAFDNGRLVSIKDDEFRLISAESLDSASDKISRDFERLLDL